MKKEKSVATAMYKTKVSKVILIRVVVHIPDNVHRKQDKIKLLRKRTHWQRQ
ncbi:MAG: hypothetical protein FWB88_10395 [Defluviitaleaceae bacterium]|nr:hypothetical protein [Defluviitaleaceae bacterium]